MSSTASCLESISNMTSCKHYLVTRYIGLPSECALFDNLSGQIHNMSTEIKAIGSKQDWQKLRNVKPNWSNPYTRRKPTPLRSRLSG